MQYDPQVHDPQVLSTAQMRSAGQIIFYWLTCSARRQPMMTMSTIDVMLLLQSLPKVGRGR